MRNIRDYLEDYLLELVLGILTAVGTVLIVAHYGDISAWIAIAIANLLTSLIPLVLFIVFIVGLIVWLNRRRRWRWRRW